MATFAVLLLGTLVLQLVLSLCAIRRRSDPLVFLSMLAAIVVVVIILAKFLRDDELLLAGIAFADLVFVASLTGYYIVLEKRREREDIEIRRRIGTQHRQG